MKCGSLLGAWHMVGGQEMTGVSSLRADSFCEPCAAASQLPLGSNNPQVSILEA